MAEALPYSLTVAITGNSVVLLDEQLHFVADLNLSELANSCQAFHKTTNDRPRSMLVAIGERIAAAWDASEDIPTEELIKRRFALSTPFSSDVEINHKHPSSMEMADVTCGDCREVADQ